MTKRPHKEQGVEGRRGVIGRRGEWRRGEWRRGGEEVGEGRGGVGWSRSEGVRGSDKENYKIIGPKA